MLTLVHLESPLYFSNIYTKVSCDALNMESTKHNLPMAKNDWGQRKSWTRAGRIQGACQVCVQPGEWDSDGRQGSGSGQLSGFSLLLALPYYWFANSSLRWVGINDTCTNKRCKNRSFPATRLGSIEGRDTERQIQSMQSGLNYTKQLILREQQQLWTDNSSRWQEQGLLGGRAASPVTQATTCIGIVTS